MICDPSKARRVYSVSVDALSAPDLEDDTVESTIIDQWQKGASDGLGPEDQGRIYATDFELRGAIDGGPVRT